MDGHEEAVHTKAGSAGALSALERALIDRFQRGFPLSPRPYREIAAELGVTEEAVIGRLAWLLEAGVIGRIGAVIRPHTLGASLLAALAVPPARLEEVAAIVNGYEGVNHNYEREHALNLWFVVTGADHDAVEATVADIERRTGLAALRLPMLEDYHIDLGFPIAWN